MANVVSHVAVTTPTAGMPALLPVTVKNHARSAMRGATSGAATRDARKGVANRAHHVLKKNVRHAAHTPSAACHVLPLATGCHVRSDARDLCNAVINAHLFAARIAQVRCTARPAHRARSKLFELISSC